MAKGSRSKTRKFWASERRRTLGEFRGLVGSVGLIGSTPDPINS